MNVIEMLLREVIEYATDPAPSRADTLRISRRLYRSLHSPPVDLDSNWDVGLLDLSLRIKDALDRDIRDDSLESNRDRLVAMLIPPPPPPPPSPRPTVIRSTNPFEKPEIDPPVLPVTVKSLRSDAVVAAPAGDRRALMLTCAYGYAVLDCAGTRAASGPAREPVLRRTEELVRRVRLLIVENEELKDWIDHVELHRDRVERNMQSEIRDLRQRLRELEGYVIALEAGMYQSTVDPVRLASTVRNTGVASRLLVGVTENVLAGLILGGVAIGGMVMGGISSEPPLPPNVSIEITTACDNVLIALDSPLEHIDS
jgi:hypothetical protein